jgi:hypothetical protein
MSQILYYRQHWMATLKERHACDKCGELAMYASWNEIYGAICEVNWFCKPEHEYLRGGMMNEESVFKPT